MADEIKVSAALSFVKGSRWGGAAVRDLLATMSGTEALHNTQVVGTSEEALLLGDAGAGGWLWMRNHGPTNKIAVKAATGATPLIRMEVGECCLFRLHPSATAPFVQADVAPCSLEYLLLEL